MKPNPTTTPKAENPKEAFGKLKPQMHTLPTKPLLMVAEVMLSGAEKYGLRNWRNQPINASTYFDAIHRHLNEWFEDLIDLDKESLCHHLAHIAANCLITLDAMEHGTLVDDRDRSEVLQPR
jgi:Cu2+-containing amine oxidase